MSTHIPAFRRSSLRRQGREPALDRVLWAVPFRHHVRSITFLAGKRMQRLIQSSLQLLARLPDEAEAQTYIATRVGYETEADTLDHLRILGWPLLPDVPAERDAPTPQSLADTVAYARRSVETTGRALLEKLKQPSSPDAARLEPVGLQLMVVNFGRPVAALLPDTGEVVVLADHRELWPLCDAVAAACVLLAGGELLRGPLPRRVCAPNGGVGGHVFGGRAPGSVTDG
jgi:hypothetical protein